MSNTVVAFSRAGGGKKVSPDEQIVVDDKNMIFTTAVPGNKDQWVGQLVVSRGQLRVRIGGKNVGQATKLHSVFRGMHKTADVAEGTTTKPVTGGISRFTGPFAPVYTYVEPGGSFILV